MNILLNPLGDGWVYPDQDFNEQLFDIMYDIIVFGATTTEVVPPEHWEVHTFDEVLGL
jgi:hypothetical protein